MKALCMRTIHNFWLDANSPNFGVQALTLGQASIAKRFDGEAITVTHGNLEEGENTRHLDNKRLLKRLFGEQTSSRSGELVIDFAEGDSFTSIYGTKRLIRIVAARSAAVRQGNRVVLGPQTVGPFESRWSSALARRSLSGIEMAFARDERSAEILSDFGVPDVHLASDVAIAMDPTPARSSHARAPAGGERFLVGINPSGLMAAGAIGENYTEASAREYARCLRLIAGKLETAGCSLVIIPHVGGDTRDSDARIARELAKSCRSSPPVLVPADARDAKRMIGQCDAFVASRFHASIAAFSQETPFIAVAYSPKYHRFYSSLGFEEAIVKVAAAEQTAQEVVDRLLGLVERREDHRKALNLARKRLDEYAQKLAQVTPREQ
jgi:colanic acid/amylovoran biosynthesis protein